MPVRRKCRLLTAVPARSCNSSRCIHGLLLHSSCLAGCSSAPTRPLLSSPTPPPPPPNLAGSRMSDTEKAVMHDAGDLDPASSARLGAPLTPSASAYSKNRLRIQYMDIKHSVKFSITLSGCTPLCVGRFQILHSGVLSTVAVTSCRPIT